MIGGRSALGDFVEHSIANEHVELEIFPHFWVFRPQKALEGHHQATVSKRTHALTTHREALSMRPALSPTSVNSSSTSSFKFIFPSSRSKMPLGRPLNS